MKKTKMAKVTLETDNFEISFKVKDLSDIELSDLTSMGDTLKTMGGMVPMISMMGSMFSAPAVVKAPTFKEDKDSSECCSKPCAVKVPVNEPRPIFKTSSDDSSPSDLGSDSKVESSDGLKTKHISLEEEIEVSPVEQCSPVVLTQRVVKVKKTHTSKKKGKGKKSKGKKDKKGTLKKIRKAKKIPARYVYYYNPTDTTVDANVQVKCSSSKITPHIDPDDTNA